MQIEYITASCRYGVCPIGDVYKTRAEAERYVDPALDIRVIEVDLDDLSTQPQMVRDFVQEQLKFRTRRYVRREGEPHAVLIHPLQEDVPLKEGDTLVQIDPPRKDEP